MRPRHVNRNFTKPEAAGPMVFYLSSFEQVVKRLNISPEQYQHSSELKEWVRRNKDHKYVPTSLLETFGFRVNTES
jgi:hypothetical protein